MNYREKMREYLKEPNEICNHYGKWGILNKEQRVLITRLLNEMDSADAYIKTLYQENEQLKNRIDKAIEYIKSKECQYGDEEDDNYDYDIGFDEVIELLEILKGKGE